MPDEVQSNGADVNLELAGQKVNLRNVKSLNTLATVLTLLLVILIGYIGWQHTGDTKEASKELTVALKEMTQAARESNCLMAIPMEKREASTDLCRRISR